MKFSKDRSEDLDRRFFDAVDAIAEDVANDANTFDALLVHYAALFDLDVEELRQEWNLYGEDLVREHR